MDVIYQPQGDKPRVAASAAWPDGGANIFIAMIVHEGSGAAFKKLLRVVRLGTDGRLTPSGGAEFLPPEFGDSVSCCQSGSDLHVFPGTHVGDPQARLYHKVLRGVCVPYGAGQIPLGAAGAFVPPGEPQEAGVTEAQVRAIVNAAAIGITGAIKGKVQEALREERVLTESMFAGGGGSATVYQQLRNTSYSGAKDAIQETHNQP